MDENTHYGGVMKRYINKIINLKHQEKEIGELMHSTQKNLLKIAIIAVILICLGACSSSTDSNGPISEGEYLPLTSGSTWNYYSESTDSSTSTVTGKTKQINGKTYSEVITTGTRIGTRTEYNFVENGEYFTVGKLASTNISLLYLKESAKVGETWSQDQTFEGEGVLKHNFEMIEKGISHEVQGEVFTNVFKIKYTKVFNGDGETAQNIYFSKGIGIIQYDFGEYTNDLISYEIK
jgi:hypothetical protein